MSPMAFLMLSGSPSSQSSGVVLVAFANAFAIGQDGRRTPLRIWLIKAPDTPTISAICFCVPCFMAHNLTHSYTVVKKKVNLKYIFFY